MSGEYCPGEGDDVWTCSKSTGGTLNITVDEMTNVLNLTVTDPCGNEMNGTMMGGRKMVSDHCSSPGNWTIRIHPISIGSPYSVQAVWDPAYMDINVVYPALEILWAKFDDPYYNFTKGQNIEFLATARINTSTGTRPCEDYPGAGNCVGLYRFDSDVYQPIPWDDFSKAWRQVVNSSMMECGPHTLDVSITETDTGIYGTNTTQVFIDCYPRVVSAPAEARVMSRSSTQMTCQGYSP
jgi:hypothetical protein